MTPRGRRCTPARPRPTRPLAGGRRARVRRAAALALAATTVALAGCLGAAPLPPQPTIVEVTMRDHAFDVEPKPPLPVGRAVFEARNAGQAMHELAVVALPERDTDHQVPSSGGMAVPTLGVIHARAPGERGRVAVDLTPGRYALVCLVRTDEGLAHTELGQRMDFEVGR